MNNSLVHTKIYMVKKILQTALPISLANLGYMLMQLSDLMVVGRVSPEAVAAVGSGSAIFSIILVFGIGLLFGMEALVSQAFGRNEHDYAKHLLRQSMVLVSIYSALAGIATFLVGPPLLDLVGVHPHIRDETMEYLILLLLSLWPLLMFSAMRVYLQSIGRVQVAMWIVFIAVVANVFLDMALVFGWWGSPALGTLGVGVATLIIRLLMLLMMILLIRGILKRSEFSFDLSAIRSLLRVGLPAALQVGIEVGAFASTSLIAARFAPPLVAAHQIVLNLASVTFMLPMGISSAAAVLVGRYYGAGHRHLYQSYGSLSIVLAALSMAASAVVFAVMPESLVRLYNADPRVIAAAILPMYFAAAFQLFDGIQIAASGALRGLGETRISAVINGFSHWVVGIPLGMYLIVWQGMDLVAIWLGLASGLLIAAALLIAAWLRRMRALSLSS